MTTEVPDGTSEASGASEGARRSRGFGVAFALLASAVGAAALAHAQPAWVEGHYARGLYPRVGAGLSSLSAAFDSWLGNGPEALREPRLSLGELFLVLFVVGCAIGAWRSLARGGPLRLVARGLALLGVVLWTFLGVWGFNYAREPLARSIGLEPGPVAAHALEEATRALFEDLEADLEIAGDTWADGVDFAAEARSAWARALGAEPTLGWNPDPVLVAPLLSRALSASGISGIFGPFSQEAHVVAGLPVLERGFIACHEVAHVQGWAREDEANYLAYRVGVRYGDEALRISARGTAARILFRALRRADPIAWREIGLGLDPRVVALFEGRAAYWQRARVEPVARAAQGVNDAYLRTNQQADGVRSYGRMVDLVVADLVGGGR